jgi:hypothetical protein
VTVVVMTRDRWPDLRHSLPRHEAPVILVDNGSTDGTPELVRKHFPHVDVVELADNHGSVARNIGVQRARTPYVAFADDDSWWAPGALAAAVEVLDRHPRLAVLAGHMLVGPDERPDAHLRAVADSPLGTADDLPGPSILGFLACGAVVRADAYLAAGGFDDVIFFMARRSDSLSISSRWAGGLAYVDSIVAHHHPSPVRDALDRQSRGARNALSPPSCAGRGRVVLRAVASNLQAGAAGRLAIRRALPALLRALLRRRQISPELEAARRLLDSDRAVITASTISAKRFRTIASMTGSGTGVSGVNGWCREDAHVLAKRGEVDEVLARVAEGRHAVRENLLCVGHHALHDVADARELDRCGSGRPSR